MVLNIIFIILLAIFAIVILFVDKQSRIFKIFSILIILITAISGIISESINKRNFEKSTLTGEIEQEGIDENKTYYLTLLMGKSELEIEVNPYQNYEIKPFNTFNPCNFKFIIKRIDNKLYVSSKVYDVYGSGEIIAEIENNEWTINPNNYFKRNYDDNAIEVIDEYEIPIFQLELINQNTLRLGGVFSDETDCKLVIFNEGYAITRNNTLYVELLERAKKLERLFRYPSEKYFSVRIN